MIRYDANGTLASVNNAFIPSANATPDVAGLTDGGFLFLRSLEKTVAIDRYDADGAFIGSRTITSFGSDAKITGLTNGGYAVCWVGQDTDGAGIKMRIYAADGTPVGGLIAVNAINNGDQSAPVIAAVAGGGVAVTWNDPNVAQLGAFFTRIFGADGSPLSANLEVTGSTDHAVMADLGGRFVVAGSSGDNQFTLSIISAAGVIEKVAVLPTFSDYRNGLAVTGLASGEVLLTWTSETLSGVSSIMAQVFDANLDPVSGIFTVDSSSGLAIGQSTVTAMDDGGFVVSWRKDTETGELYAQRGDILARRYDGDGRAIGTVFAVTNDIAASDSPAITAFGEGDFVALWRDIGRNAYTYREYLNVITGTDVGQAIGGTSGSEALRGLGGDDHLNGFGGNDILDGGSGDDVLDGGTGDDYMAGGTDDDHYFVNSAGDRIEEIKDDGVDTLETSVSYSIVDVGVENIILTGTANIDATGNGLSNDIYGNSGNNILDSGDGGKDRLYGGAGDDTYIIGNERARVFEADGQGHDLVKSSVSFTLYGQLIEDLILTGKAAIGGQGNALDNHVTGNSAANILYGYGGDDVLDGLFGGGNELYGGEGNDILYNRGGDLLSGGGGDDTIYVIGQGGSSAGGTGNDTYRIQNNSGFATIVEGVGEGFDTIIAETNISGSPSNIEAFILTGKQVTLIRANELDNVIVGNAASNMLYGLQGNDKFVFRTSLGAGIDGLPDFAHGADKVYLDQAIFTGLSLGALDTGAFALGSTATQVDDRILYDAASGRMFYDADGVGGAAAIAFAYVNSRSTITANDFVVYTGDIPVV